MTKGPVNITAALRDMRLNEGTWHISKNMSKLKQAMKKPMLRGKVSIQVVQKQIGDDELWDDLEGLKKGEDMVPAIKKAMKRLGIKEDLDLSATGDTITSNASQENKTAELNERWNEKVSLKGLDQFRTMYKTWLKSGIDPRFIKTMEKLYDDMVIGGMYSSRSAEEAGILKIDGKTKYKNQNW